MGGSESRFSAQAGGCLSRGGYEEIKPEKHKSGKLKNTEKPENPGKSDANPFAYKDIY
ncbi:MAG: hypothetical protein JSS34_05150 [Proteobacteria bacterium]|nr:hypothetical protein [Pseudomonadota bacterium]